MQEHRRILIILMGVFSVVMFAGLTTAVLTFTNALAPYPHMQQMCAPVYSGFATEADTWIGYRHASFRTPDSSEAVSDWFTQAGWQVRENNATRSVTFLNMLHIRHEVGIITGPSNTTLIGVHTAVRVDTGIPLFNVER